MKACANISALWRTIAVIGTVLVAISAIGQLAVIASPEWESSREKYLWPAKIPYPKDDPYSKAKFELGRTLFFDPILSGSKSLSCASCHNPSLSWGDGQPRAVGLAHERLPTRCPTLLSVAWVPKLGWSGQFPDLESVAMTPITSPKMMNLPENVMVERLSAIPGYVAAFNNAFHAAQFNRHQVEQALATYERSILPTSAPFDRWIDGDRTAINKSAQRGFELFNGKANCAACHSGWAFTDSSFHDIGTAQNDDVGRGKLFPDSITLRYAFKTPTLRDVARRGPYMHDGSVPTLSAVIDLYDKGGIDRPSRAAEIYPLGLSGVERTDLIAFLETLTGRPDLMASPVLPR
jgi:cytochrome c peroxidase